jgi:hypothetical protein
LQALQATAMYKNKEVKVLEPGAGLTRISSNGHDFWVYTADLITAPQGNKTVRLPEVIDENLESHKLKEKQSLKTGRVQARLSQELPGTVSSEFLEHVKQFHRSRLLWDEDSDEMVQKFLSDNGITLLNARPVKSDMRSVAGCFTILVPEDLSILPELKWIPRGKNTLECNDLRLVVAMAKLGFAINSFTKEMN